MIRTVLIDGEREGVEQMAELMAAESDFTVVGRFQSALQAARMLPKLEPDAVFVGVELPRLDGFRLVARLPHASDTAVVFVSGKARYAVQAFDAAAVDYLLKPFDPRRFRVAVDRIRSRLKQLPDGTPAPKPEYAKRLGIVRNACTTLVSVEEIDWFEAAGNYIRLHCGGKSHLLRDSMTNLIARLDPEHFARVHRSAGVNLDRVRSLQSTFGHDQLVVLACGTRVKMSAAYREGFEKALFAGRIED